MHTIISWSHFRALKRKELRAQSKDETREEIDATGILLFSKFFFHMIVFLADDSFLSFF